MINTRKESNRNYLLEEIYQDQYDLSGVESGSFINIKGQGEFRVSANNGDHLTLVKSRISSRDSQETREVRLNVHGGYYSSLVLEINGLREHLL